MAKQLTKEIKRKYLKNPENCSFCNSSDIVGDNFESAYNQVWRTIYCENCGEAWDELFTLTDIEKN